MGGQGAGRLRQRGAALLDLVVGAAVALIVFSSLVTALHFIVDTARSRHAAMVARTESDQMFERMDSEAASAWSIFVPSQDLDGASNADGHEVDFTTEDAARHLFHWAYRYDAHAMTVTRYTLATGSAPQATSTATEITAFGARAFAASAITDPASPIYDPLFAGVTVPSIAYTLSDGTLSGNGFVQVSIAGAGTSRSELLATTVSPTQFTVVVKYTPAP